MMCPLLDLLNHGPRAKVDYVITATHAALVLPVGAKAYEVGAEVLNVYGPALCNQILLSRYGFAIPWNPHDRVKEVVFHPPKRWTNDDLSWVVGWFGFAEGEAKVVRVKLSEGLRRKQREIPSELLRAASVLLLGVDYDEDTATCADKARAAKAVARALRQMWRSTGAVVACGRTPRRRRGEPAADSRLPRVARLPMPSAAPARAAAIYAVGRRRVLLDAARCAEMESEMAALAAKLELEGGASGAECSEPSPQPGDGADSASTTSEQRHGTAP